MRMAEVSMGGGIFAKTTKTQPLQPGFSGEAIAMYQTLWTHTGARYARQLPYAIGSRGAHYRLSALPNFPYHARSPSLYQRHTIAVPGPLHVRISPRNPRMKRRWYGDGTAMVRCKWGELLGCAPTFGIAEGLVRHAAAPRYGNAVKGR